MIDLILASASPRRAQLLRLAGLSFRVDVSAVDEPLGDGASPAETACGLALAKGRAVARRHTSGLVLAADTIGVLRGQLLGKPADAEEATAMLRRLRGRWHDVLTGVALLDAASGREAVACETTHVLMRRYSESELAAYVATGDPLDKAAAYAIQNTMFHPVARLRTCYTNVMGLPLCAVYDLLAAFGESPSVPPSKLRRLACSYCAAARALSAR